MTNKIEKEDWDYLKNLTETSLPKNYSLVVSKEIGLTRGRITQIRNIIKEEKECPDDMSLLNLKIFLMLKKLAEENKIPNIVSEFSKR